MHISMILACKIIITSCTNKNFEGFFILQNIFVTFLLWKLMNLISVWNIKNNCFALLEYIDNQNKIYMITIYILTIDLCCTFAVIILSYNLPRLEILAAQNGTTSKVYWWLRTLFSIILYFKLKVQVKKFKLTL